MEYTHCCLERRLRRHVERTFASECAQCVTRDKPLTWGTTLATRCTNRSELDRIHLYFIRFCSTECNEQFHAELVAEGYTDKILVFIPLTPQHLVELEAPLQTHWRQRVLTLPIKYTGTACDHCTARHMDGTPKFKMCSACTAVRYCSRECQVADWKAGHREKCGKPLAKTAHVLKLPTYPAEERKQHRDRELVEETTHAACFDEVDRARRVAARAGTCSWHECTRKVEGVVPLSMVMTICRLNGPPHITPTAYCCKGHSNRDHAGCIGAGAGTT